MSKKQNIRTLFNNIANRYDFLNHLLSLNIDKLWRKKAISFIKPNNKEYVLDAASGTGDFAFMEYKYGVKKVLGIDISENMLDIARQKAEKNNIPKESVDFVVGDSENLSFENNTFTAATVAFGVRNFENLKQGLKEIYRVLNENGQVIILEFSQPDKFPVKQLYGFYFKYILPNIGGLISGNKPAYKYLHDSVFAFPQSHDFLNIMNEAGFKNTWQKRVSFGIATIYVGEK